MMDTTRRGFLTGMLAAGAVAALPAMSKAYVPTLHGDLIHDDTEALQALLDGKSIIRDGQLLEPIAGQPIVLQGGRYLVSNTLRLTASNTVIRDAYFKITDSVKYCIQAEGARDLTLTGCIVEATSFKFDRHPSEVTLRISE